jgi:hypothetical protein
MTRANKRRWRRFFVLSTSLLLAVIWGADQLRSVRDRSEVAKLTGEGKTVCVGRHLVDVPAKAEVSLARERLDGFAINTVEEGAAEFGERIAAREAEIEARAVEAGSDGPGGIIEARNLRVPGMVGRIIIHGHDHAAGIENGQRVDSEWVAVEAHAHKGGLSFSLSMDFAEESDAELAETLLKQLQLRGEDEVPTVPGFCVWRAVFAEPLPPHKTEHVVMFLGLPGHPDIAMALASLPGQSKESGLLSRVMGMNSGMSVVEFLQVSRLRARARNTNGMAGEEVLERIREANFANTYVFNWETQGVSDDLLRPYVSLELQGGISERAGGKPVNTSLHEDALLALWDSVASSIRVRASQSGFTTSTSSPTIDAPAQPFTLREGVDRVRVATPGAGMTHHFLVKSVQKLP